MKQLLSVLYSSRVNANRKVLNQFNFFLFLLLFIHFLFKKGILQIPLIMGIYYIVCKLIIFLLFLTIESSQKITTFINMYFFIHNSITTFLTVQEAFVKTNVSPFVANKSTLLIFRYRQYIVKNCSPYCRVCYGPDASRIILQIL